jgi:hypothetical protein
MKAIGSSFCAELRAAGLLGLPFTWGSDGEITFHPDMPPEQITAVEAVYAAHVPATPLATEQAEAQARIDAYFETLYHQAVPNNAMKAEYDAAYMVAKRWLDNQGEPAPERVKALAESYGVSNVQAAQVVVLKWTEAQALAFDLRGAARLRAKLAIRQAVTREGVAAAELAGRAAMEAVVYTV